MEFAFTADLNLTSLSIIDYIIDFFFIFDIIVNFRSTYFDPKTEAPVTEGKKIAYNYVLRGRFWIDMLASIPFELIIIIFTEDTDSN